ncbi:uncharacterized protein J4E88_003166 [Alternaria novae-zelandiae]|uniref:uncharacterized protein n=1 Tax=Alternaria novae-zelandiae TaxID=430562 RepID=UPI0020C2A7F7|nr:uncharacterized protein J4E88_003166 [Alternaria novae-zelandiae]KAI4687575.1 hypothetical protein J4E88_003166 [Alternaria novae-zelandiae]
MASNGSESPDESFFNDLSQQAQDQNATNGQETQQDGSSKVKRIACVLCRKRKLRCDGTRPTCSTCKRLNHDCAYDEVRKKSGPKRGYVKLLEQRLQQVETLLKTQDTTDPSKEAPRQDAASTYVANTISQSLPNSTNVPNTAGNTQSRITGASPFQNTGTSGNDAEDTSWEMIGLGLEEPLPPQEIQDDLYEPNPACSTIMTNLPASEEAFDKSKPMDTGSLDQLLNPNGVQNLQPLGGIVLTAAMFGRNLLHLHRPLSDDNENDINGGFWNRHRSIERILLQTSLSLPDSIRLPSGIAEPNVVFTNMCIHTSAICLHQAAIFKADKFRLPASVSNESKIRCVTAAAEIASIMRMISHMDLGSTRPKDQQMKSSLQFLLQAMEALRRKNPLTESFLVQLDLDLEGAGLQGMRHQPYTQPTRKPTIISIHSDPQIACSPLINIREPNQPAAPPSTFGNGIPTTSASTSNTQYSSSAPAPPFQLHNIDSIDMNAHNATFLPSQFDSNRGFGSTAAQAFAPSGGFTFQDNEMDLSGGDRGVDQPSPATISSQSRGGSTSHSSYSPGQPIEHNMPYRASPKMTGPGSGSVFPDLAANGGTFPTNGFNLPRNMGNEAYTDGFVMGNEWEYAALNAGTGLTPMADASWDSMLESVTMGWDSVGPGHENQPNAAGV